MEVWKDVVGYEGIYNVSSLGQVKAIENPERASHRSEHILSQKINECGYPQVTLCKDGIMKTYSVHRIVAKAFIPNDNDELVVDHINTVKTDNRVANLRWVTVKENSNNCITKINRSNSKKGNKNPNYGKVMPKEWIDKMRAINQKPVVQIVAGKRIPYQSAVEAWQITGVFSGNITRVCKGERQTAGGYKWEYKDDEPDSIK